MIVFTMFGSVGRTIANCRPCSASSRRSCAASNWSTSTPPRAYASPSANMRPSSKPCRSAPCPKPRPPCDATGARVRNACARWHKRALSTWYQERKRMTVPRPPEYLNDASVETLLIHADRYLNSTTSVAPPIYQTASFRSESAQEFMRRAAVPRHPEFYSRYGNPTLGQAEAVLAALEGGESALVTASGMAAVSASVLSLVQQGTHVVAQTNHYGGTLNLLRDLLPKFGVEVTQVDQRDTEA